MNHLIVVAHPDDEVLGAGGAISRLVKSGENVAVCILSGRAAARRGLSDTLAEDEAAALSILGVEKAFHADFPNIKMNTVPHLDLVRFIEGCIEAYGAQAIVTHHPADTNNDHVVTFYAAQAASRLFQRREGIPALREFCCMEVPSSTEWSLDASVRRFEPNTFVEIGREGLDAKLRALAAYRGVMRDYPHPRSAEALTALAAWRGAQAGLAYAEAFECVYRSI